MAIFTCCSRYLPPLWNQAFIKKSSLYPHLRVVSRARARARARANYNNFDAVFCLSVLLEVGVIVKRVYILSYCTIAEDVLVLQDNKYNLQVSLTSMLQVEDPKFCIHRLYNK